MPPVYIVQQNAKIRIRNRRLQVENGEEENAEVLTSIPLAQVDQVVLFGNISLTTPAINALLETECDVVFLTADGDFRGRLVGSVTPHVPLRRAQYERTGSPEFILPTIKGILLSKVSHQRTLLQRHSRDAPDKVVSAAIDQLGQSMLSIPHKTLPSSLLGLEGAATAGYFCGYRRFFPPEWNFKDRNRRPPADPVNVLLSFGYTLLAQITNGAIQTVGLDPFAGVYHQVAYNRPALALDLMEEFRPVVDGVVMWCCRSGQITPADFTEGPAERPVILSSQGCKRFITAFEERMDKPYTHPIINKRLPLRQCVIEQARQLVRRFLENRPGYTGMGFH
ncbi:MAG: CRISPR-associated endonuclease Cas1 [Leptolinea sp.]|jgi:CRISPR-associated protein Cas1|nr:CRISPR-associated endonuclease Cas1 [Leptolinea sp.]